MTLTKRLMMIALVEGNCAVTLEFRYCAIMLSTVLS